ncbi:MAG: SUMF1/EgtB/PvdO family nonheme iron enzyme [Magnetococcales bacterium]|nr:SUMF1/EgtB/PvdO family nonheme iron enzyme [Magnetococcales bacterium]
MLKGLEDVVNVIRRCLRINREERYADFRSILQELELKDKRSISGDTIIPVRLPEDEKIKWIQEKAKKEQVEITKNFHDDQANDVQNITSQKTASYILINKNLIAAAVFGILLVTGIIISVKNRDNQRLIDASSYALQTVPPSLNIAQTDKISPTNGNKVSVPSGQTTLAAIENEVERQKMEEAKSEIKRLIQEAAKFKRDALEEKRAEAEAELTRLREDERLRKEQVAKKREEAELARLREEERLRREQESKKREEEELVRIKAEKLRNERANLIEIGEFIRVPGGTFQMGCGSWQSACSNDENPVHEVTVEGFEIGKYEVTQGQWKNIMGINPSKFVSCGDSCPVEQVSWNDVQQFISKLNMIQNGCLYRLPTEAEWEYACRSGGQTEKYCGGNDFDEIAWYKNNSGGVLHPVGQKKSNSLGIFDMSGNVDEWVLDWYDDAYYENSASEDPTGPTDGSIKVFRGGGWGNNPVDIRSTIRRHVNAGMQSSHLGFRLVRRCQ